MIDVEEAFKESTINGHIRFIKSISNKTDYLDDFSQEFQNLVNHIDSFELDVIDEKDADYYSAKHGTLYKHNIGSYFCLTFYGVSYESNNLSSFPHDDHYYLSIIFTNEIERDIEYLNGELFRNEF